MLCSVYAAESLPIVRYHLPRMVRPCVPHYRPAVAVVFWDCIVRFSPWVQATVYGSSTSQRVSCHSRQLTPPAVSPNIKVRCVVPVVVSTPHIISQPALIRKGVFKFFFIFFRRAICHILRARLCIACIIHIYDAGARE